MTLLKNLYLKIYYHNIGPSVTQMSLFLTISKVLITS